MKAVMSVIAFAILSIVVFVSVASEKIQAGYEGIKINMYGTDKGVDDIVLVTGRAWYNPLTQDLVQYPTTFKTIDYEPFKIPSKDGTQFIADPSIEVGIAVGKTPSVYKTYRKDADDFFNTVVYNRVRNAFRDIVSSKTTDELINNRSSIENEISKYLQDNLVTEGVVVKSLTANLAGNEQLQAQFDQRAIETQKQKIADTANSTLLKSSKTKAEAVIIEAEAEAKANQLRQNSLTDNLIRQKFIEKWDGKLPVYGESPTLIRQVTQ